MLIELPHPTAGKVPQIRSPMRFSEAELEFNSAPPLLGQHTSEVLAEIGFDADRIAQLARDGII
jgi:crotonobetainyl-CoA:carnitine CoA-transferase CaiB-like acyl-CoA transferase